jgi:HlyD family secretion protein
MTRNRIGLMLVAGLAIAAAVWYYARAEAANPEITTQPITRGDIVETVGATGTLEAVTTVQVGTQVSGTVQALYADFNSIVHKGQVIARLDPSLFQTQVEQSRANLVRAQADADRLRVAVDDAQAKLKRARELSERQLIPATDLETAEVTLRSSQAQLQSAAAQVTQARASLQQAQVSLDKTVITAPIDGIVVARNVDVGQTVAASLQAPTLYVIAADLTQMRVNASIDESDVGRLRPGQVVRFRVDAYPTEEFTGSVSQVRLNPVVVQNVVTYAALIDVPNQQLKLKPGMTATVTIQIAGRENVLRVPNAALRFRPTAEIFAALGQTVPGGDPSKWAGGSAEGGWQGRNPAGDNWQGTSTGGRERSAAADSANGSTGDTRSPASGNRRDTARGAGGAMRTPSTARGAETVDALFGPLPTSESSGRVWVTKNGKLQPVRVRLGLTDGAFTELIETELAEGTGVVTSVVVSGETAARPQTNAPASTNPLMPQRPGGSGGRGRR